MGTLGAAVGAECFQTGAMGSVFVGFEELAALKPMQLHLRGSKFVGSSSLRRRSLFLGSSTDCEILAGGRLCYGPGAKLLSTRLLRTGGHVSRSTIEGHAHQDSETNNFQERHFPGESSSINCGNGGATENSFDGGESSSMVEQGLDSKNRGTNSRIDSHHHSDGATFRIGRRMLLGAVSVGLSAVYSSPSEGARAADEGFKFSLTKGSWFLGDSEADTASEGEKKDSVPQEKESRVYDATVLGEPVVIGNDNKERVWTRLLANRVIYLGEAETVADSDDKLLELEIVQTLRDRCFQQQRGVALAFQAFPCPLQPQLNAYMSHKLTEEELRAVLPLSEDAWLEYLPMLQYCKDNGVRLIACGAPEVVLRTVQAEGVQALSKDDKRKYIPPTGGGYKFKSSPLDNSGFLDSLPDKSGLFGPGPYRFAQARVVEDYTMTQVVSQVIAEGGAVGLLVVITGSSHVQYGARGTGLPAWISKNKDMQKRTQAVVLLNPERQYIRNEGDLPVADFLWYSAAKACTRNCFDRAEVARVMGAAGRRRDALPKDLQIGLKQGLVAPTVLQNFFELEQNPIMAELTGRFQGLRERWFADPRFLERLAIEEAISITTTLIAQYERRGARFWQEIDYVATDTIRGAVVDFFTVWLPAPRLSFREINPNESFNALDSLKGLLGSFPDNAFQRPQGGESWGLGERVGGILVGGLKLFAVGFVSSIGTLAGTNFVLRVRQLISPEASGASQNKRSPILKTAVVYGSFLATSANLRYQVIAGVVEHWVADYWLASQPLAGNALSFVARTANSYFGTSQWVDLARFTGLQAHGDEADSSSTKQALAGESAVERISEAVSSASAVERISEAVSSSSAVERISEAVSSASAVERISEAVSSTSAIAFLGRLTDLQARSDETDSSSSNSTSAGESDVERNSDTVVTSSSVAEDHSSTNNGSKTIDGSKNGSVGEVQEKVEVPKS